jgi:hypothetical protein
MYQFNNAIFITQEVKKKCSVGVASNGIPFLYSFMESPGTHRAALSLLSLRRVG